MKIPIEKLHLEIYYGILKGKWLNYMVNELSLGNKPLSFADWWQQKDNFEFKMRSYGYDLNFMV